MNPDTTKQIIDALKPLADKLGQGAGHLYEVYVRQMFAEGVAGLAIAVLLWLIYLPAIVAFLRKRDRLVKLDDICGEAFLIAGAVIIVFTLSSAYNSTLKLINPEYAAIHRIIQDVRGPSN